MATREEEAIKTLKQRIGELEKENERLKEALVDFDDWYADYIPDGCDIAEGSSNLTKWHMEKAFTSSPSVKIILF